MGDILLLLSGSIAISAALGVILCKEAVHSALFLTVHLLGVGSLFLFLTHQFLAVAQLLVYAGAVMVVFMFAVTTLSPEEEPLKFLGGGGLSLAGVVAGIATFGGLFMGFQFNTSDLNTLGTSNELVPVSKFAADLFGPYLLPFEGTAFLLLVALIGAVLLGGRRQVGDG